MNYIAGLILLHLKNDISLNAKAIEEETFTVLTILMEDYGLAELYREEFDKLRKLIKILENRLEQHIPDLKQYFPKEVSVMDIFVTQWVITLFSAE